MRPAVAGTKADIRVNPGKADIHVKQRIDHRAVILDLPAGDGWEPRTGDLPNIRLPVVPLQFDPDAIAEPVADTGEPGKTAIALNLQARGAKARGGPDIHVLEIIPTGTRADINAVERLRVTDSRRGEQRCREQCTPKPHRRLPLSPPRAAAPHHATKRKAFA